MFEGLEAHEKIVKNNNHKKKSVNGTVYRLLKQDQRSTSWAK